MSEEYRPINGLFADVVGLMWELSMSGSFSNYGFIRRAAQSQQPAYVDFLKQVRDAYDRDDVFREAHRQISVRLKKEAEALGYEVDQLAIAKEHNIWLELEKATTYHRTDRVKRPEYRGNLK